MMSPCLFGTRNDYMYMYTWCKMSNIRENFLCCRKLTIFLCRLALNVLNFVLNTDKTCDFYRWRAINDYLWLAMVPLRSWKIFWRHPYHLLGFGFGLALVFLLKAFGLNC